jgi:hypothetical protein
MEGLIVINGKTESSDGTFSKVLDPDPVPDQTVSNGAAIYEEFQRKLVFILLL